MPKPKTRANGQGTAYKRGRTWTAEIVVGSKWDRKQGKFIPDRRTKGGFPTKTKALEYIPTLKAGPPAAAAPAAKPKPPTTLASLWEVYSGNAMLKLSKSKQTAYRVAYRKLARIAHFPIGDIDIQTLQDEVNDRTSTYYPAKDIRDMLRHLYNMAVAQGDIHANLATFLTLPELEEAEPRPFTEEEQQRLWKDYSEGNILTGYILMMIYTGMMPGELFKCEKKMINWDRQQIVGCGLKTKERKKTPIVVANIIVPVLEALCDYSSTEMLLPIYRTEFYDAFHAILTRCGIEDRTPYACRHTTATALALQDIDEKVIQAVMRHAKFESTKRYIHKDVDTSPMLDAVNKIAK